MKQSLNTEKGRNHPAETTETTATPDTTLREARDWIRVNEACEYSSLSKPKLYDLMNRGLVRSVALREEGQIKGTRRLAGSMSNSPAAKDSPPQTSAP